MYQMKLTFSTQYREQNSWHVLMDWSLWYNSALANDFTSYPRFSVTYSQNISTEKRFCKQQLQLKIGNTDSKKETYVNQRKKKGRNKQIQVKHDNKAEAEKKELLKALQSIVKKKKKKENERAKQM